MDFKSQYATRYRKDLSTENVLAKVAHQKSLTQKENRHKQYRKSRGLALADINISPVKEGDSSTFDANETLVSKKDEQAQILARKREDLLRRFKEEKQLRKLKEQREKAKRGIFRCGVYKHDAPLPSFVPTQYAPPMRPEKCPPPEARVTRSTAKSNLDNTVKTSKVQRSVNNTTSSNKLSVDRRVNIPLGPRKQMEKENLVFPVAANTRTTKLDVPTATRRLPNTISAKVKPAVKSSTGVCSQRKIVPKEKNKATEIKTEKLEKPKAELPREAILLQPTLHVTETAVEKEKALAKKTRERSFAPLNFQFQPMNGIPIFQFDAMTPRSTNAFLSPCFSWSPAKIAPLTNATSVNKAEMAASVYPRLPVPVTSLTTADSGSLSFSETGSSSEVQQSVGAIAVVSQPPLLDSISETTMEKDCSESPEVNMEESPEVNMEEKCANVSENTEHNEEYLKSEVINHDVPYFREILRAEIERLTLKCVHWDQINEDVGIPEDAKALIRTTVGQTRLLMSERFKQFEGLVDDCEFKRGERETTCTDLDGFWDMVHFQIEDVLKKCEDLRKLQENNWQQVNVQAKKTKKRIVPSATSKPSTTCKGPSQGDNARTAARNRLAAIKAALKNKIQQEDSLPVPSDVQAAKDVDTVVFDAGFFKVESPAKSAPRSSCKSHQRLLCQSIGANFSRGNVSEELSIERLGFSGGAQDSAKPTKQLTDPLPSPNDLLLVKKVLFGNTESMQSVVGEDAACPVTEDVDHTQISMSTVSNTDEQILANQCISSEQCQSPELTGFQVAAESPKVDNLKSVDCPVIDGRVMCSPERKIQPSRQQTALLDSQKDVTRNAALDLCCDPLDFLKSGTPPNLTKLHSSDLRASTVTASDLIVFSPAI